MILTTEHIAIAELVVYIPVALVSIFVVLRHGFHRQLGWIYLFILSGIRIAGGVMEIRSHNDPSDTTALEWGIILQSVGLSPLLLSSLGLLKRVCDEVSTHIPGSSQTVVQSIALARGIGGKLAGIYSKRATATSRRSRAVQLLHVPALIALVLSIVGGTDQFSSNVSDHSSGKTETKAGVVLFLVVYICLFLLCIITFPDTGAMQSSQKRIFVCVLIALPLIAVRLLYSLIGDFNNNSNNQFSIVNGNPTIQLTMATIEELLVVVMYAIVGVVTPRSLGPANYGGSYKPESLPYRSDPECNPEAVNAARYATQHGYGGNVYDNRR